ncbi:MAG: SRPBCC family protein [Actinomycetota bacterium]
MAVRDVVTAGWPVALEMAETAPAPPEVVWDLLTDWEHQGDWMLEAGDFVVVSDEREGVGVEAEATLRIGGIKTRDRVRVAEWDPPRRLAIEHLGWVQGRGVIELTPVAGVRTHVLWREELRPPLGLLGAVGMTALKPLMGRIFRRDLKILVGLARAAARRGASGR